MGRQREGQEVHVDDTEQEDDASEFDNGEPYSVREWPDEDVVYERSIEAWEEMGIARAEADLEAHDTMPTDALEISAAEALVEDGQGAPAFR
jgi:hypothetical protein